MVFSSKSRNYLNGIIMYYVMSQSSILSANFEIT